MEVFSKWPPPPPPPPPPPLRPYVGRILFVLCFKTHSRKLEKNAKEAEIECLGQTEVAEWLNSEPSGICFDAVDNQLEWQQKRLNFEQRLEGRT